ncbi:hypothetical protein [Leucobacter salsicius]|uniref:hypothetical protein n=1 Tax=Leucobacter salsicius TaxID=664638 RepID=UPI00037EECB6|nr:hypothetical protein [Leucobacter salsicius]
MATDASVTSINRREQEFLETHGAVYIGERCEQAAWKTAQLEDGRIVGTSAMTVLGAQLSIEVWWGSPVVWIVPDGNASVHTRYLGEVSSAQTRSREARTFPVTSGPVEYPTRDGAPVEVQGTFDFGLL